MPCCPFLCLLESQPLKEEYEKYTDLSKTTVYIAGNDIWRGREHCEYWLNELKRWNANIYSVIPEYSYESDPDDPNNARYAQLYIYDHGEALGLRRARHGNLDEATLDCLQTMLERDSPYVGLY